ncbi:MAG: L-serine ammonia-lyase, iron-sulfur-dependent, subunit alpha [Treponema sp.]|jgi:L-serine dehydratase|nr:L-serine ammonia-lyase, iron-sulfur-dependent, subunit alpha [Treponema sp.]
MLEYHSIAQLAAQAEEAGKRISDLVLADQAELMELSPEKVFEMMKDNLDVMRRSAEKGAAENLRSTSGLTGGGGFRMTRYAEGSPLAGSFCAKAVARALAVAEYNASMGKIVAAPTAGSCGILPAAILTIIDERGTPEDAAVMALFTAGALGLVIANEASIAGAEGGCQAECGSAAAIAAGALVEISGGSPLMAAEACAIAIKNQLGLVCDPVAGLVEVPCVKRNAGGIMCAIAAADMALAGIKSVIPVDEVIGAMREIGEALPVNLKETALGGLAATQTGLALRKKIFG